MTIFFTGDTHWGHKNILAHDKRPWSTIREHDEALIEQWNSQVNPTKDTVYHLGDFSWYGKKKTIETICKLHGRIHLVLGNHDQVFKKEEVSKYIQSVNEMLSIHVTIQGMKYQQLIVMCHYSMRVWNKRHYGSWHLYAHSHGKVPPLGKSFDIGLPANDYKLLSLEEITERMKELPK